MKAKEAKMRPRRAWLKYLLIITSLIVFLSLLFCRSSISASTRGNPNSSASPSGYDSSVPVVDLPDGRQIIHFGGGKRSANTDMKQLSEEEALQAYKEVVMPALGYLYDNYPIASVRREFRDAIENMGTRDKEVLIYASGVTGHSAFASTIPADESLSKPEVVFWMGEWVDMVSNRRVATWPSVEVARRHFEDELVMVVCHEYYHAHNQQYWRIEPETLTLDQLIDSEAECWGYTCEKIIGPMVQNGRGPTPGEDAYVLNYVYVKNRFNRRSDGWKQIIRTWVQSHQE
ncbi:MAG: hypothetical protein JW816_02215 [Candidatus Buchananbacteria bacterium]|nr:hypothetical protein [Candidatus Buchananbacteria bacterium]